MKSGVARLFKLKFQKLVEIGNLCPNFSPQIGAWEKLALAKKLAGGFLAQYRFREGKKTSKP
jgi:hypothetical protein